MQTNNYTSIWGSTANNRLLLRTEQNQLSRPYTKTWDALLHFAVVFGREFLFTTKTMMVMSWPPAWFSALGLPLPNSFPPRKLLECAWTVAFPGLKPLTGPISQTTQHLWLVAKIVSFGQNVINKIFVRI